MVVGRSPNEILPQSFALWVDTSFFFALSSCVYVMPSSTHPLCHQLVAPRVWAWQSATALPFNLPTDCQRLPSVHREGGCLQQLSDKPTAIKPLMQRSITESWLYFSLSLSFVWHSSCQSSQLLLLLAFYLNWTSSFPANTSSRDATGLRTGGMPADLQRDIQWIVLSDFYAS